MGHTVIVSDLHVDTWTGRAIGQDAKDRETYFYKFLNWCETKPVDELIIAGDLMDIPPYEGLYTINGPIPARVVARLAQTAMRIPLTYIAGNHDTALTGLRCERGKTEWLGKACFCYPNYCVKVEGSPGSVILVEHGHFHDPALVLYARDAFNHSLNPEEFEKYNWVMQRRDAQQPGVPGIEPVPAARNAYEATRAAQEARHISPDEVKAAVASGADLPAGEGFLCQVLDWIKTRILRMEHDPASLPVELLFWAAALREMHEYVDKVGADSLTGRTLYQVYGHTHRTVYEDPIDHDGVPCVYVNCGSWRGDLDGAPYLDVDETGKVWLQDWINDSDALKFPDKQPDL